MGQKSSKLKKSGYDASNSEAPGSGSQRIPRRDVPSNAQSVMASNPLREQARPTGTRGLPADSQSTGTRMQPSGSRTQHKGAPTYRPLDSSRNEIRLLRILPPSKSTRSPRDLEFAPEIVQCQLQYESLDRIEEVNAEASAQDASATRILDFLFDGMPFDSPEQLRSQAALKQSMKRDICANKSKDKSFQFPIHPRRKELLQRLHAQSAQRRQNWLPPDLRSWARAGSWKNWLQSWIWSPLSGDENYAEETTDGYLALSYVWSDSQPPVHRDEHATRMLKIAQAGGLTPAQLIGEKGLPQDLTDFCGNLPSKARIMVDGKPVEVGKNLEQALRTLREIPEVKCGKRVWVDSLCINQTDIAERNREVLRMGEIYGKAERVVSYIGEEQDNSGDTLEIMSIIGEALLTDEEMPTVRQWFFSNLESELPFRIAQLLSRPYWTRIWITQEVILGNDNAITICGSRRFPTSQLLTFGARLMNSAPIVFYNFNFNLGRSPGGQSEGISVAFLGHGLAKLRDLRDIQANLPTLRNTTTTTSTIWFRTASGNYATDPRDVVYGMLTLVPRSLVARLNVDYSPKNTYRNVMIDFAVANITSNNSLFWILHRPWSPFPGHQDWPSWVPNLALPFSSAHFNWVIYSPSCSRDDPAINFRILTETDTPMLLCDGIFIDTINQATTSLASKTREENEQVLATPGMVDYVAEQGGIDPIVLRNDLLAPVMSTFPEPPPVPGILPHSPNHVYQDLAGLKWALTQCFRRMDLAPTSDHDSLFDIPRELLEGERDWLPDPATLDDSPTLNVQALGILKKLLDVHGDLQLWGVPFRGLFSGRPAAGTRVPELRVSERTSILGRLFTTCSGYVGAALYPLRSGDQIYILSGCKMPVALRPSTKKPAAYELVGGVWVPGLMNGEAFDGREEWNAIALV